MRTGLMLVAASGLVAARAQTLPENLQAMVDLADQDPDTLMQHIADSPMSIKVQEVAMPEASPFANLAGLPIVTGHGMGDSCFEPGFKSVTKAIAKRTGTYAVCIPTGNNILSDTINGFLMSMDKSVDVFAKKIRADPKLAKGFNAIGFSQGNSLIRGYIHKYNDPPVNTFISVHGTVMGVAAFPGCFRQGKPLGLICKSFAELLGDFAYNGLVQNVLFQAGYYRDPQRTNGAAYKKHCQIAQWNNEGVVNATYTTNFNKVKQFLMVKAEKDSMVYPNLGEHWGSEPDGTYGTALEMKDTKFYKNNTFGLKDADTAGKIAYDSTPGNHLQFTDAQLFAWVDKYFIGNATTSVMV